MDLTTDSFFAFWDCGPIEKHEHTAKISYRIISGKKYMFKKLDYRAQTKLGLRVTGLAKQLEPLFAASQEFVSAPDDATDPQREQADNHNSAVMMRVLPDLLGLVADPTVETLLNDLVVAASVNRGNGEFESLSNQLVAEDIFGDDISLQLPVAATVLEVNLAGFIRRVVSGFS